MVNARALREQALVLLRQAQSLDGKKPYLILSSDEEQLTGAVGWFADEPTIQQALELLPAGEPEDELVISQVALSDLFEHCTPTEEVSKVATAHGSRCGQFIQN